MAEFPCQPVAAFQNLPVHDDSGAASRPDDDPEHNHATCGRAIGGLGEGEAIGVVGDADFPAEQPGEVLFEGLPIQRDGIGIFHESGRRADRSWNAQSYGGAGADLGLGFAHHGGDIRQDVRVACGRGSPPAPQRRAVFIENQNFGLRAA